MHVSSVHFCGGHGNLDTSSQQVRDVATIEEEANHHSEGDAEKYLFSNKRGDRSKDDEGCFDTDA